MTKERIEIEGQGVVLQSETVLKSPPQTKIHEGQISLTHGFVPYQPISASLPPKYKAWEEMATNLPRYISEGSEREHIKELPLLEVEDVQELPNEHLSRSIALVGNFAHAYYYNQRLGSDQASDPLPESVLIPWQQLTKRIQRKLPPGTHEGIQAVRIHYDTFLTNWRLNKSNLTIDGVNNTQIKLNDLTILSPIFGNAAEYNFNMTFVIMELRFAAALHSITNAIKAVASKDDAALLEALQSITSCIEDVTDGLDYINPNQHSEHHVDPTVWTKTVAKIDGKIPDGVSGLSGSAMPLFHALDTFIERGAYTSTMGKAMVTKYQHQPEHVISYLSALRQDLGMYSIRKYIAESSNPILKNQYDLLIAAYLGEQGLMGVHALKVYGYMKINFRNGRLLTNGGHDGTSTIATEPQRHIYDDFTQADAERLGDYKPTQQYATKISMHLYSDKAASIVLDASQSALHFQPGDHCAIQPENSSPEIESALKKYALNSSKQIVLNATWKEFFRRHLGLSIDVIELGELLKHADLSLPQSDVFNIEELKPLTPRYYSVSPVISFPQRICLTVGIHKFQGKPKGLCSSYLLSDVSKYAIERVPARHFHLPKSKETPILMFAAGTGISPFMGFIAKRAQYTDKSKNFLFFSTPSLETFYHQEELGLAVNDGKLNLSVIFSRGEKYDSGNFTAEDFSPTTKYQGKHVDQLINEQAETIADLIVNQHAQIYVCGNPGFADTVRAAIITALNAHSELPDSSAYVDTMMADFRFNTDVYAATNYAQEYPSISASEIASHNKPDDCWGIINGSVYNLTRFIHTHPGGQKIILVNGGIDMSSDYNYIKHNQRPQIEAQLQQYKIGVLAIPVLQQQPTINLHEKCKKFVEALTEIENTLRNNTTYYSQRDEAYLWREVYGVFVDGSLASYRKPGSGNAGSLNYVLGPLLKDVCLAANFSTETLDEQYVELMSHASNCANYIRQSSIGPLSSEELEAKKRIFDVVLRQTFQFINELKGLSSDILRDIEVHADDYDKGLLGVKLEKLVQAMVDYSGLINHIVTRSLPNLSKTVPNVQESHPPSGCVFARQVQQEQEMTSSSGCVFARQAQQEQEMAASSSGYTFSRQVQQEQEMAVSSSGCTFSRRQEEEPSSDVSSSPTTSDDVAALGKFGLMPKPKTSSRAEKPWAACVPCVLI